MRSLSCNLNLNVLQDMGIPESSRAAHQRAPNQPLCNSQIALSPHLLAILTSKLARLSFRPFYRQSSTRAEYRQCHSALMDSHHSNSCEYRLIRPFEFDRLDYSYLYSRPKLYNTWCQLGSFQNSVPPFTK